MPGKPVYSLKQIETALTTSWEDGDTKPHTWYDDFTATQVMGSKPGDAVSYSLNADFSMYEPGNWAGHVAMDPAQTTAARFAFRLWDDLVPFSLKENNNLGPETGAITFDYSSSVSSSGTEDDYGTYPNGNEAIRNEYTWLDAGPDWPTNQDTGMVLGGYGFYTGIHEVGHALGLTHPGPYNGSATYADDAVYAQDNRQYTVMSYFGYYDTTLNGGKGGWTQDGTEAGQDGGTENGRYLYPQTPMVDDIAAIQAKYGADTTTRSGATVYGFNCNITPTTVPGTTGITIDESQIYDFAKNPHPIFTIWDSGGDNTLDCSKYNGDQAIDLTPGHYSSVDGMTDNVAIAYGTTIQHGIGGGGKDTFITPAASDFSVDGGAGQDTLDYSSHTLAIMVDTINGVVHKDGVPVKNIPGGTDTFSHIETFIGGSGHDTFIGGTGSHTFIGGGDSHANNVLDETACKTPDTFDLTADTVTKNDSSVSTGRGSSGNPLQLKVVDNFSFIQTFLGGSSSDVFKNIADGSHVFDGGGGSNTLDYSSNLSPLTIDLLHGTVSRTYLVGGGQYPKPVQASDTFSNIDIFKGGYVADKLIDGPGTHSFDGGAGTNTVVLNDPFADYSISHYVGPSDNLTHTVIVDTLGTSGDGKLDLVHVQTWQDPGHSGFLV